MGTDIHMHVEKFNDATGKWEWVKPGPNHVIEWSPEGRREWYDQRNYNLFAMLADVRNDRGFAGVKTGEGFEVIAMPRGLPDDMSPELRQIDAWFNDGVNWDDDTSESPANAWLDKYDSLGDHSFTWLTLGECLAFDYSRTTILTGIVTLAEYKRMKDAGESAPRAWCGGLWGGKTVVLDEPDPLTDMQQANKPEASGYEVHVRVSWEKDYRECAGVEWFALLDELKTIGSPDKVRLVFGFDS